MAYRDLPAEEAQKRFTELTAVPEEKPLGEVGVAPAKKKAKRKVVIALVPANK